MKKLVFIVSSILLVFALTGCDLLNDEVKQTIEDFCLENPDDESCVVKEDLLVNDVFLELYDAYQTSPDTFCEQYVDGTSVLLDDCVTLYSEMLPEDLLDYEVTSVNSEILADTTEYMIVFDNIEDNKQVTITVSFSFDESTPLISQLSYEVGMLRELAYEAYLEEMDKILEKDLALYLGDPDYIASMFIDDDAAHRISSWQSINNNNMSFEIGKHFLNEDGSYTVIVYGVLDVVRNFDVVLVVYPSVLDGELVLGYGTEYEAFNQKVTLQSLNLLIDFLAHQDRTVEEVTNSFYLEDYSDIIDINSALQGNYDYVIAPSTESDELFTLSIHTIYEDIVLTLRYSYEASLHTRSLQIEESVVTKVSPIDFELLIEDFVYRFNQNTLTKDEMNLYFTTQMPIELEKIYNDSYSVNNGRIHYYEFVEFDDENILRVYYDYHNIIYKVDFLLQEDDTYKMSFTLIQDNDFQLTTNLNASGLYGFFEYVNDDVEGVCEEYFDDSSYGYCTDLFHHIGADGYMLELYEDNGEYITVTFSIYRENVGNQHYEIDVDYTVLEDRTIEWSLVNTYDENEGIETFLQGITVAINDSSTTESVYDEFTVSNNVEFTSFIEYIHTNNYHISLEESNIEFSTNFMVYNVYNSNDEFMKSMLIEFDVVRVNVEELYIHKLEVKSIKEISLLITDEEINTYIEDVVGDINDVEYPKSELCVWYEYIFTPCKKSVSILYLKDFRINIHDMEKMEGTNIYNVVFQTDFDNEDFNNISKWDVNLFFYEVDGTIQVLNVNSKVVQAPNPDSLSYAELMVEDFLLFLEDLIDESISKDDLFTAHPNLSLYDFYKERDIFLDFVTVEYQLTGQEYDNYIDVVYIFKDIHGEETRVVYTLNTTDSNTTPYTISKLYIDEDFRNSRYPELVDYLNGDIIVPMEFRFHLVGTDKDLVEYLQENNYRLELIKENVGYIECMIMDENDERVHAISYWYYTKVNMLNQYTIVGTYRHIGEAG